MLLHNLVVLNSRIARAYPLTWELSFRSTGRTVNNSFQKADFVSDNVKKTAFYNLNGEFVALTQDLDAKAIPAKAMKEINENYKGYSVNEVIVIQNNTELNPDADESAYFVDLKSDTKEVLVKITPEAHITFYKQVK